jgi:hypothetical protein
MKWETKQQREGWWVRYGNVCSLPQHHFAIDPKDMDFHTAPARKGFYAFPRGYTDFFLVGCTQHPKHISQKSYYLKDENGKRMSWERHVNHRDWPLRGEKQPKDAISPELWRVLKVQGIRHSQTFEHEGYICILKKPHIFRYTGDFWHHLADCVDPEDVIDLRGSWVKTSFRAWKKAFRRVKHINLRDLHGGAGLTDPKDRTSWNDYKKMGCLAEDPYKSLYAVDRLEVFFERVH